ncbi:hypothetical protein ACFY2W_31790 [Streptomyces sp. NPDC001262]|uniref:hypothetical protein n=1 Tax=unclassified Streptomyces TaxID=2593676 RepID=UPI003694BD8C
MPADGGVDGGYRTAEPADGMRAGGLGLPPPLLNGLLPLERARLRLGLRLRWWLRRGGH